MSRLWGYVPPWVINALIIPIISVVLGFLVAAIAIVATGADPTQAYLALFQGAFTNPNAFAETLVSTVPYIFLGLGVALGFRAGLFNIGAEGQFYIGALAGVFVAYSIHGLPAIVEIPLALLAAMAAGFLYAGIAGFLKAQTGAHEVITTIMLNYVAYLISNYLVTTPGLMLDPNARGLIRTPYIDPNATLPIIFPGSRLHLGFLLALLARSNPWAILPAALLFGALHNGASFMQLETQVSSDLISIVQASVIAFVAAPEIIRWLLRLRRQQVATAAVVIAQEGATPHA